MSFRFLGHSKDAIGGRDLPMASFNICNRKGENAMDQTGIHIQDPSGVSSQVLYQLSYLATGDQTWSTATHTHAYESKAHFKQYFSNSGPSIPMETMI